MKDKNLPLTLTRLFCFPKVEFYLPLPEGEGVSNNHWIRRNRERAVFKFLSFLVLWSVGFSASASYITLNTSLTSKVEGRNLKVLVAVVNKGDESAFNVQAEIKVGEKTVMADKRGELPIDGTYSVEADLPLSINKPGAYPLILVMHYTDANQYPFSALTVQTFAFGREAAPDLFGQMKPARFSSEGKMNLLLKNISEKEIKAETKLILSRELTVDEGRQKNLLAPRSQKKLTFNVSNFSALAGSTYQAFAVTEYEDKGLHYTVVSPARISIIEKNVFKEYQPYFIALIGLLLLLFVYSQFKGK